MALVLKGQEFIATEALSARLFSNLAALAARRTLTLNGIRMCARDLTELAERAARLNRPLWPVVPVDCAACYPNE